MKAMPDALPPRRPDRRLPLTLLLAGLALLVLSGVRPTDRFTWVLEVFPILIGVPILLATHRRFPLTPLLYVLIFLHAIILMVGGHYTYAEVPAGFWVRDWLGLQRNNYDRLGHFAQGFMPAILTREILLRVGPLRRGWLLFTLVTCVCVAFSAFFEMLEWWTALATGERAAAFLATQGDPWDTQWDMFLCLIGAVSTQLLLGRAHDRQMTGMRVQTIKAR
jgi:putative membrane protein